MSRHLTRGSLWLVFLKRELHSVELGAVAMTRPRTLSSERRGRDDRTVSSEKGTEVFVKEKTNL